MTDLMRYSCPRCGCQISSSKSAIGFTCITAETDPAAPTAFPEARAERWRDATGD